MKRLINTFILGILGLIFVFDTFAYVTANDTISEQITSWINTGSNIYIFCGIILIITAHFIFGKYKD